MWCWGWGSGREGCLEQEPHSSGSRGSPRHLQLLKLLPSHLECMMGRESAPFGLTECWRDRVCAGTAAMGRSCKQATGRQLELRPLAPLQ
jgi:hypothetical protein